MATENTIANMLQTWGAAIVRNEFGQERRISVEQTPVGVRWRFEQKMPVGHKTLKMGFFVGDSAIDRVADAFKSWKLVQ